MDFGQRPLKVGDSWTETLHLTVRQLTTQASVTLPAYEGTTESRSSWSVLATSPSLLLRAGVTGRTGTGEFAPSRFYDVDITLDKAAPVPTQAPMSQVDDTILPVARRFADGLHWLSGPWLLGEQPPIKNRILDLLTAYYLIDREPWPQATVDSEFTKADADRARLRVTVTLKRPKMIMWKEELHYTDQVLLEGEVIIDRALGRPQRLHMDGESRATYHNLGGPFEKTEQMSILFEWEYGP